MWFWMLTTPNPKTQPFFAPRKMGDHHFWMLVFLRCYDCYQGLFVVEWWATCFREAWMICLALRSCPERIQQTPDEFFVKPWWGDDALSALGSANGRCDLGSGNWGDGHLSNDKRAPEGCLGDEKLPSYIGGLINHYKGFFCGSPVGVWKVRYTPPPPPNLALQGLESLPILSRLPQLRVWCLMARREGTSPLIWMMGWRYFLTVDINRH